jgi:hypothetical protein
VDISSASIPAVSFVITAIMPVRRHPGNEAIDFVRPELPIVVVKSQIKRGRLSFPSVIANRSQLEERTPRMRLNGIV